MLPRWNKFVLTRELVPHVYVHQPQYIFFYNKIINMNLKDWHMVYWKLPTKYLYIFCVHPGVHYNTLLKMDDKLT